VLSFKLDLILVHILLAADNALSRRFQVCIVYNNPSVANSVILMIYCCRFYDLYVNKS
jgi:hypothetical protein